MKNKLTIALIAVTAVVVVLVGLKLVGNQSAESFGAAIGITRYPNSGIAARFLNITATAGTATAGTDGSFIASGENRLNTPRNTGGVTVLASSSVRTLTAAEVCDSAVIVRGDWAGIASSTAEVVLPSAGTLFADCLTANGDSFTFLFRNTNATSASTTAVIAGASTTLVGLDSNADIINGANEAFIRLVRYSATELVAHIVEATAAD